MATENDHVPVTQGECRRTHEGLDRCIKTKIGRLTAVVGVWTVVGMAAMAIIITMSLGATEKAERSRQEAATVKTIVDERTRAAEREELATRAWRQRMEDMSGS